MGKPKQLVVGPVQSFWRGFRAFPEGIRWLKSRPKYLALLMFPMFVGILLLASGMTLGYQYGSEIVDIILFDKPDPWYGVAFYYVSVFFLSIAVFLLILIMSVLLTSVVAAPIYETISMAVERDYNGGKVEEISFWASLLLIFEELKKVLFILTVSVLLLFIPGLNVISIIVTALLAGWDFYDYPLARRGWGFRQRLNFVYRDIWGVLGFGVWMIIPFLQFVVAPFAVPGGTLVSLQRLKELERDSSSSCHNVFETPQTIRRL